MSGFPRWIRRNPYSPVVIRTLPASLLPAKSVAPIAEGQSVSGVRARPVRAIAATADDTPRVSVFVPRRREVQRRDGSTGVIQPTS